MKTNDELAAGPEPRANVWLGGRTPWRCAPRRLQEGTLRLAIVVLGLAAAAGAGESGKRGAAREEIRPLFDGRTLRGWVPSGFEGEAKVAVVASFAEGRPAIVIEAGTTLGGITWTQGAELPRMNYEISLEAMRLAGGDFFCGLTFPVAESACTLVVGGWGGTVVGISNVDRVDASGNETAREMEFQDRRWYRIRVRVTTGRIEAWIDGQVVVDLQTQGRRLSLRPGDIQKSLPLGIATYMTRAAVRDIQLLRF